MGQINNKSPFAWLVGLVYYSKVAYLCYQLKGIIKWSYQSSHMYLRLQVLLDYTQV